MIESKIWLCIKSLLSKKHVDEIISENSSRFDVLKDVEKIMIYGHSFSDIDLPYFERIINSLTHFDKVRWEIVYYNEQDREKVVDFINKYAISWDNVELMTWTELQNKGQLSIWG